VTDPQALLNLIDKLYGAALDADRWPPALQCYAGLVGARGAHLVMFDKATGSALMGVVAGYVEDGNVEYITHYAATDERLPRFRALAHGQPSQNRLMYSDEDRRRSATYNEFFSKFDAHEQLLVRLDGPDATEIAISAIRSVRDGPFESDAFSRAAAAIPHFERAVAIQARIGGLIGARDAAEQALERLTSGVVLLDDAGRVVFANRAALAICAACDGLAIWGGTLSAARAGDDASLQRLIGQAAATGNGLGLGAGGALAVPRPSGKRPYALTVSPLARTSSLLTTRRAAAIVFLADPEAATEPPHEALRRLYGLTGREAALAAMIAGGERLETAAERLGLASETARSHLKRVFAKTDTHSQAQLVALLLRAVPFDDAALVVDPVRRSH
jgi:DNA-binding CsgD family transcriptional regulator